jgi:hypothetical protein
LEPGDVVNLTLSIAKGRQYLFGQLVLSGLDEGLDQAARKQWKLNPGEPMNEPYATEYIKSLLKDPRYKNAKLVSQGLELDKAGVVNVRIKFRE